MKLRTAKTILTLSIGMLLLYGCGGSKSEGANSNTLADSTSVDTNISSSVAIANKKDSTRKFIRTADLKFRVKNVINATYFIEDLTKKLGGFVTYTNLTNNIGYVDVTAISTDSSLETTRYTVTNSLTIRIPTLKLDTTLKEISRIIDFLDYRTIKAQDVALQLFSNKLTEKRTEKTQERLTNAISSKSKKLTETTSAEELLSNKKEQADIAKISNLYLNDQINYSTINLSIYQREIFKRELIANEKNVTAYEPNFGRKLLESISNGWKMLENIILFVFEIWGLLLLLIVLILGYRLILKKHLDNYMKRK